MSFSGSKYPVTIVNPDAGTNKLFSFINLSGIQIDVTSMQLINGVDDPLLTLDLDTGYSDYPLNSDSGVWSFAKGTVDISTNPPTALRIFFDAVVPSGFSLTGFVLGKTVQAFTTTGPGTGSYQFDVPVDLDVNNPFTIFVTSIVSV